MGQFSWITQDTDKSISNLDGYTFKVVMRDDKGNKWVEQDYEGYGVFGGKDYYDLVAEMNGYSKDNMPEGYSDLRDVGIEIEFEGFVKDPIFPSLTEDGSWYEGQQPDSCPDQGWTGPEECDCECSCC
jgi:hypothetical protein